MQLRVRFQEREPDDPGRDDRVRPESLRLLRQLTYQIVAGHEDANDAGRLRHHPLRYAATIASRNGNAMTRNIAPRTSLFAALPRWRVSASETSLRWHASFLDTRSLRRHSLSRQFPI